jgi:hypothetical protein
MLLVPWRTLPNHYHASMCQIDCVGFVSTQTYSRVVSRAECAAAGDEVPVLTLAVPRHAVRTHITTKRLNLIKAQLSCYLLCDGYVCRREQSTAERHKAVLALQCSACYSRYTRDNEFEQLQFFLSRYQQRMAPNTSQRSGPREQPMRTTFGRLEGVSECVVLPSTLGYRERQVLQKTAGFEYGK